MIVKLSKSNFKKDVIDFVKEFVQPDVSYSLYFNNDNKNDLYKNFVTTMMSVFKESTIKMTKYTEFVQDAEREDEVENIISNYQEALYHTRMVDFLAVCYVVSFYLSFHPLNKPWANNYGDFREGKTPVTILQELLLKRKINPTYNLILNGVGTHEPIFKYEVAAAGQTATGTGKSKKEAKHNAANELLQVMRRTDTVAQSLSDDVTYPYEGVVKENAVGELQDFCCTHRLRPAEYKLIRDEGLPHAKVFSWSCTISSFTTEATARTKKNAKQMAAQEMLLKLKECLNDIIEFKSEESSPTHESSEEMDKAVDNVIKKLSDNIRKINTCEKLGVNIAEVCFSMKDDNLPELTYLDSLKDHEASWFDSQDAEDMKDIFTKITQEIPCEYTLRTMEPTNESDVPVVLTVNSSPSWTFVAVGDSLKQAVHNVFGEAVKFMVKMRL